MFEIMPFDRRTYRMSCYNPLRELEQMEKSFWGEQQVNPFRTDISETADGYKLEADLPGFRKEDIHIDIDDDILTIKAEHTESKDESGDKNSYIRRERYYGAYTRRISPSDVYKRQVVPLAAAGVEHVGITSSKLRRSRRNGVAQRRIVPRVEKRGACGHHALIVAVALGLGLIRAQQVHIPLPREDVYKRQGPSGSGKSTFLRCLNLLEQPTAGTITFAGTEITDPKVNIDAMRRQMGMVFQHFNLFPNMTVRRNITLAPVQTKLMSQAEADAEADKLLARVGLADRGDSYPSALSGGQKQRIAIAVSYTHLDVYKRQVSRCSSSCRRNSTRRRSKTLPSSSRTSSTAR